MLQFAAIAVLIPAVILSSDHQAATKVAVGDAFPDFSGEPSDGGAAKLSERLGERGTVVVTSGRPDWMQAMMAADLAKDFGPKYAERGVAFVSLGKTIEADQVKPLGVAPQALADALGERPTPRVFVLDSDGKIVWFDLEYTLSTHRELHATLDAIVGEKLAE